MNDVTFNQTLSEDFEQVEEGFSLSTGESHNFSTMKVTCGPAAVVIAFRTESSPYPPEITGRSAYIQHNNIGVTAEFDFTAPYAQVRIGFMNPFDVPQPGVTVRFVAYDDIGQIVDQRDVTEVKKEFVTLTAPSGKRIKRLTLEGRAIVDNFVFTP